MLRFFFFFKQKTAYEITYGDWSSDVCSSDLHRSGIGSDSAASRSRDARSTPVWSRAAWVRSEERRVGKECRRLCRSPRSPYHKKKKTMTTASTLNPPRVASTGTLCTG